MERDVQDAINTQPCMRSSGGFSERDSVEIATEVLDAIMAGYTMRLQELDAEGDEDDE